MGKNKSSKNLLSCGFQSWEDIYIILKELYMTTFKWVNMPLEINTRYLELKLFETDNVVFFKDEDLVTEFSEGFVTLHGTIAGELDVYFEPTHVNVIGGNGYSNSFTNHKDCVVIWNNNTRIPPMTRIEQYARRIYNLERTIDVNVQAQKTPIGVRTKNKNLELSVKHLMSQIDSFEPFVFTDENLDIDDSIKVIDTKAPFVADKLDEIKRRLWNEALSYIGIENNSSEKNERLTPNEILVSNGLAIANKNSRLLARQKAIKEINVMFGLDIGIEVNNIGLLENELLGGEIDG